MYRDINLMAKIAPPTEQLHEGLKLGKWKLGKALGKGAFGAVYEGMLSWITCFVTTLADHVYSPLLE